MRAALAALAITAFPAVGLAQPAPTGAHIKLALGDCPDLDARTIEALVGLELGDEPPAGTATPAVSAVCADGLVIVEVNDPVTQKSLTRAIDPAQAAPAARSRLLALAIVELIHASWTELTMSPAPQVPPAGPAPEPSARRAALAAVTRTYEPRRRHEFRLLGIGASDVGPDMDTRWGGGLRIGWDGRRVAWSLDVVMQHADRGEDAGDVSIDTVSADAAVMWRLAGTPTLRLGGGLRFGVAQIVGNAHMPFDFQSGQVTGPFAGPMAVISVSAPIGRLVLEATLDGGMLPVAVHAAIADAPEAHVADGWFGLRFGVGMLL